jgi:hypothetical protein
MSGNLSVGPLPPLISHTSVPLHLPSPPQQATGPAPDGTAFQSLLAGSPAPAFAAEASPCINRAGLTRMAGLAPAASSLPVAPGPQAAGRTLAAADVSMAAWPAPPSGAAFAQAASAVQVDAIQPVAHVGLAASQRLLPSFP